MAKKKPTVTDEEKRAYRALALAANRLLAVHQRPAARQPKGESAGAAFPEILRAAIRESGLTHYMIGKRSGVSPTVIDRFARGERDLRLTTAGKISAVLNLELSKAKQV